MSNMTDTEKYQPLEGHVYRLVPDRRFVRTASSIPAAKQYADMIVLQHDAPEAEVWATLPGFAAARPVYSVWLDPVLGVGRRDAHVCPHCGWGGLNINETEDALSCDHCKTTFPRFHDDQDQR